MTAEKDRTTVVQETKEKERTTKTTLSKTNIWVRRISFLVMLLAFLYFVSGGVVKPKKEAQAVAEPIPLPQWFSQWLDSQESEMGEMSLKCEKVQGSGRWNIRCRNSQADNQNPEWLNIDISSENPSKEEGDGESGLCCHTCTKPIPPPPTPPPLPPPPPPSLPDCTYHSETLSTELEMELKSTLELKLWKLLEYEISKQTSEPCKEAAPSSIQRRLQTSFGKILEDEIQRLRLQLAFQESSVIQKNTKTYAEVLRGSSGVSK